MSTRSTLGVIALGRAATIVGDEQDQVNTRTSEHLPIAYPTSTTGDVQSAESNPDAPTDQNRAPKNRVRKTGFLSANGFLMESTMRCDLSTHGVDERLAKTRNQQ